MKMRTLVFVAVTGLTSCATFRLPMTPEALSSYHSGPALLAYLGQADASGAVCDASRPRVAALFTPELDHNLVSALLARRISPDVFEACVELALPSLATEAAASLLDALAAGDEVVLADRNLEQRGELQRHLAVLQRLVMTRAGWLHAHDDVVAPKLARLSTALERQQLGPIAAAAARELLESDGLEHGVFHGELVTLALIERLGADGANEAALTRFALRLPMADLREASSRRVIRLRIARSPFAELRTQAAAVEDRVIATGHNAQSLADHPLETAWYADAPNETRTVVVDQRQVGTKAELLAAKPGDTELSVVPTLSLTRKLWARLKGLSRPVTVCERTVRDDPTPCLDPSLVTSDSTLVMRDARGDFHLIEEAPAAMTAELDPAPRFTVPLRLDGQLIAAFDWNLRYQRPDDFIFTSEVAGETGPALEVRVEQVPTNRFVFTVIEGQRTHTAVIERADLGSFRIVSRGGPGTTGAPGRVGSSGRNGAVCLDGQAGQDGGAGGQGGPGGKGGAISVSVSCADARCDADTLTLLAHRIVSEGGQGGEGGPGGAGGSGGRGGSGRSRLSSVSTPNAVEGAECLPGADGRPGMSGQRGFDGQPGPEGSVRIIDLFEHGAFQLL